MRIFLAGLLLTAALLLAGCMFCMRRGELCSPEYPGNDVVLPRANTVLPYNTQRDYPPCEYENAYEPKLAILHLTHDEFVHSITNPRVFQNQPTGRIMAGVVPHHNVAAALISGFFAQAAASAADVSAAYAYDYDLVIILAPNHEGDLANVISSYRHWDIGEGVATSRQFVTDLMAASGVHSAISHSHMELDHSASILIPYIYHYLPGAEVAPLLLNRSLSFGETEALFHWLNAWIADSGKNVLLVASIDFSHFLPVHMAREMDRITKAAILSHDLRKIHTLNDHYLDSPAAMIILLMYLEEIGITPEIIAHTDASKFLGPGIDETTSYMIIVGTCPANTENETVRVQLTFTGDIMLHQAQANAAFCAATGMFCFDNSFSTIRPFLQNADLTIGSLETVLAGTFMDFGFTLGGSPFTQCENARTRYAGFPLFSAPDEFGYALQAAGFDLLSTANNHALDQGAEGLLRTLDVLDELGIGRFGTHRTQEERDTVLVREVQGIRFAFLSYTFSTNGQPVPPGREYFINLMSENLIRADIARAREVADFAIVMPHMGYEYEQTVRPHIKDWAMMTLSAGADIVVAGHPHVVQPMGFVDVVDSATGEIRQGFVAYCLGNFISSQRVPPTDAGVMLNLYFERVGDAPPTLTGASYVPTWVKFTDTAGNTDIRVLPVVETLQAVDAGETLGLRQVDIARMREVLREIAAHVFVED